MAVVSLVGGIDVTRVGQLRLRRALETGRVTSRQLVATYLARVAALNHRGPRLRAVISTNPAAAVAAAAARLELTALGEQGKLEVRTRSFELGQVAEAHREGQAGHVAGKLVLVPRA
jgi:hypothetical protein